MAYVKIENGVVIQKQPNQQEGFIEAPNSVVCGFLYENGVFTQPLPPEKTAQEIKQEYEQQLDSYIDSVAQSKGYDNRITASLRASYEGPWQQEGIIFAQWMDSVYVSAYQVLSDVENNVRELPTFETLVSELPTITW